MVSKRQIKCLADCLCRKISQTAFFIEDSTGVILKDQDAVLIRWREYFGDLLNPIDILSSEIHAKQIKEDIRITNADMKSLKAKKGG